VNPLYLYDDARARRFEPYALTRPVAELRAGAAIIRHRWEAAFASRAAGMISAPHLEAFEELDAPPVARGALVPGAVIANSRCIAPLAWIAPDADVWICRGRVAAVRLATPVEVASLDDGSVELEALRPSGRAAAEMPGRWVDEVWSLIADLLPQLAEDIAALGPRLDCVTAHTAHVIGSGPLYIEQGATVEPLVCFDVSAGPVLVRRGAVVRAFTRLVGPCVIGSGATVLGDRVHGCSIGETSIVRGELSETLVLGHANKAHDGFVGHSYLGRWVNLGAGTITSNLKNTYGTVALWTPEGVRDTGLQKLGTLFGDHVKTGIGVRLTTGSVIGAGSNVYGSAMPPKFVPPFSWGEGDALSMYDPDKFLTTAELAMARRNVQLGAGGRRQLLAAHERSWKAVGAR
jgi:UDP-N-acetylglucosamine diphosphorylase/glucosamine-1-phosphate N-acetyltransferase